MRSDGSAGRCARRSLATRSNSSPWCQRRISRQMALASPSVILNRASTSSTRSLIVIVTPVRVRLRCQETLVVSAGLAPARLSTPICCSSRAPSLLGQLTKYAHRHIVHRTRTSQQVVLGERLRHKRRERLDLAADTVEREVIHVRGAAAFVSTARAATRLPTTLILRHRHAHDEADLSALLVRHRDAVEVDGEPLAVSLGEGDADRSPSGLLLAVTGLVLADCQNIVSLGHRTLLSNA